MDLKKIFEGVPADYKKFGVAGWPVEHSLSPAMHNAAIMALGLKAVYEKIPVAPAEWDDFVSQAKAMPLDGFNITLPYKDQVPSLVKHGARIETIMGLIGSVNTVDIRKNAMACHSTDGDGFLQDLSDKGVDLKDKVVTILGGGGTVRQILGALYLRGIGPKRVLVFNRTLEHISKAAEKFQMAVMHAPGSGYPNSGPSKEFALEFSSDPAFLRDAIAESHLLINATSVGLRAGEKFVFDFFPWIHGGLTVYDVVYNRETELLRAAAAQKARVFGGLGMLVHQGALAFKIWFGQKPPIDVMMRAAKDEMKRRTQS